MTRAKGIAKCLSGVIEQDLSVQVAWKLWKPKGENVCSANERPGVTASETDGSSTNRKPEEVAFMLKSSLLRIWSVAAAMDRVRWSCFF